MQALPLVLLRDRDAFWHRLQARDLRWRELLGLVGFVCLACAVYGSVLAGWRAPRLSLYVAIKLPALFLGTTVLVALFNWIVALLLGSGLSFKSTVFTVFAAMAIGGWILLALAPIALFFLATGVPPAGTHAELQFAHNSILMTHIVLLALAGTLGNAALLQGLRRAVHPRCSVVSLFWVWLAAFAFVGCQLSWILRPFVGSPFFPVEFLRPDALDRNFYEFVFTEVLPFLFTGGK
jgi:MFS family permease